MTEHRDQSSFDDGPDPDEIRRLSAQAAAQAFDALDDESVLEAQNEAGEALGVWALRLLKAGVEPQNVAGALGGAGASVALIIASQWALENQ